MGTIEPARAVGARPAGFVPFAARLARTLRLFPRLLVVVLLAAYTVFLAVRMAALVAFPYPNEYTEGAILAVSQRLARGMALYPDLAAEPFAPAVYGPLYYATVAAGIAGTGQTAFWFGRALSVAAAICLLFLAFRLGRRLTDDDRGAGWTAAAVVAALPVFYAWSPRLRPDTLAVALSVGGVWVLARGRGWRRLALAVALMLAALYVRPTAVAAPGAALLYLLWRDRRRAAVLATLLVLGGGLPLLGLAMASRGSVFAHLLTANAQPVLAARLAGSLGYLAGVYPLVVVLSLAWVLQVVRRHRLGLWEIYFLASALVGVLATTKVGADSNHLLEPLVLGTVLAVSLARAAWRRGAARAGWLRESALLAVAAQLFLFHHVPLLADAAATPTRGDWEQGARLVALVARTPGPVFTEDAGWALLAGKPVAVADVFVASQMARAGLWDESVIVRDLKERRFGLVLAGADPSDASPLPGPQAERYTERMIAAIASSYRREEAFAGQVVLRPREESDRGR